MSQVRESPRHIVAVASGKGGVGKSTVTANLALALAASGQRVGLMDGDFFGPTIPLLFGSPSLPPQESTALLVPAEVHGVKLISIAQMVRDEGAIIWRGPMLHKMVGQLVSGVAWGELDYLLVDLPPGTGDVQLSLCQTTRLSGLVIVSTPQDVALKIAQKAISMAHKLETPVLGLVENMSDGVCAHCGEPNPVFGAGGVRRACERLDLPFLGEVPLSSRVCADGDAGTPTLVAAPESALGRAFVTIGGNLQARLAARAPASRITAKET